MEALEMIQDESVNPLDGAEDVLSSGDFQFNRANRDELFVETKGRYGTYKMMFVWDEQMAALQFCCEFGLQVADMNVDTAGRALLDINSGLWLGHFDLPPETLVPTFRYTQLFRGFAPGSGADQLQELIGHAIGECDRHYPAFMTLAQGERPDADDLALAMMVPAGVS